MSFIYLYTSDYGVYFKDVLSILALPNGMTYRFRYDYKYLPPTLQDMRELMSLKGSEGICALKNVDGLGEDCIPLRKIRITSIEPYERSFVHFVYELGDIPVVDDVVIKNFSSFTRDQLRLPKNAFVGKSDSLFYLDSGAYSTQNWDRLVKQLSLYGKFKKCFFIKLHSIYDQNLRMNTQIQKGRFQLASGHNYVLQYLHSYEFEEADEQKKAEIQKNLAQLNLEAKLRFSEKSFLHVQTNRRIEGRYDLDLHYFYCPRTLRAEPSIILLGSETDQNFQFPRLEIPVFIKASWTRDRIILLVLGVSLFIGGALDIFLQLLNPSEIASFSPSLGNFLQVLRNIGILGPILALVGLIITMIQNFPSD